MKKLIAALLAAVILLLAGCADPKESTVILAECVGCYRDTVPDEFGGTRTVYVVDVIYSNEFFSLKTDATNYYRALTHVNGQVWMRVILNDAEVTELVEVIT